MIKQYTRYTSFYFLFTIDCSSKHMESTNSTKYLKGVIHINYHLVQKRKNDMVLESSLNNTIYPTIFVFVRSYLNICYIWYAKYIWYFCCKKFSSQKLLPHIKKWLILLITENKIVTIHKTQLTMCVFFGHKITYENKLGYLFSVYNKVHMQIL